jgi:hypothetical protein
MAIDNDDAGLWYGLTNYAMLESNASWVMHAMGFLPLVEGSRWPRWMRWRITDNLCRHYIIGVIEDARGTVKVVIKTGSSPTPARTIVPFAANRNKRAACEDNDCEFAVPVLHDPSNAYLPVRVKHLISMETKGKYILAKLTHCTMSAGILSRSPVNILQSHTVSFQSTLIAVYHQSLSQAIANMMPF